MKYGRHLLLATLVTSGCGDSGATPFPAYPKMHKRGGCTTNGLDIPNTTCDGGPCKIGDWAENTTGLTTLVCTCM
jgi:hypothetical protein